MASRQDILKNIFVNAPWYDLKDKYLDLFLENSMQPEIGFEGNCLYDEPIEEFERIAAILKKNNLGCTMHAPFFDLAPGGLDPYVLEASRNKLHRVFDLLDIFEPHSIVCHLNYEENKQGFNDGAWAKSAIQTWSPLLKKAEKSGVLMMLENTYEINPTAHKTIFEALSSNNGRFCLDVGHLLCFAKNSWQNWLGELLPWLGQLHLHDNDTTNDHHLAPGTGRFNFSELFKFLSDNSLCPLITIEPHTEEALWQTLDYLENSSDFHRLINI
ncbi:MAG: TIM barrel protein [Thermodesulfobacteriota bacterium]